MSRYVIEGEWSGYTSGQRKIVHRTVHPASFKKLRAWIEKGHAITYGDGTSLLLSVRDCTLRERVKEIKGYTSLIKDCAYYNVDSVQALQNKKIPSGAK